MNTTLVRRMGLGGLVLAGGLLLSSGCGAKEEAGGSAAGGPTGGGTAASSSAGANSGTAASAPVIDLTQVQRLFESAPAAIKTQWDQVVTAVKSANYSGALKSLQDLAGNANLSAEQKTAVQNLLDEVKKRANEAWRGAADAANKVINEATDAAAAAREKADQATKNLLGK